MLSDNMPEEIVSLKEELKGLKQELKEEVKETKQEIRSVYFKISTYLDKIYNKINSSESQTAVDKKNDTTTDLISKIKFPLTECEAVSDLEHKIQQDPDFKKQLVN